jgi:undecaprenyl-diphosphatase
MLIADRYASKEPSAKTLDDITYKQALLIGLFQCFSLWPGFSRAGSTISGGVLLGLNYKTAADFTFIMAVPIMIGASSLSLYKNWEYISPEFFSFYAVGFVSAFVVAYISIKFFLKLIEKIKLKPFAYYRIGLAAIVAFLYYG